MHQFACPHCGARLRLKDKSFAGRTVRCPDCREPVAVRTAAGGDLIGEKATTSTTAPSQGAGRSPVVILSAAVAVLAGLAIVLVLIFRSEMFSSRPATADKPDPDVQRDPADPENPPEPVPVVDTVAARLTSLGQQMSGYTAEHGTYPAPAAQPGLPPDQRLSWMAVLASAAEAGVHLDPEHGWTAPQNDRFVRRRIDSFQNPAINTLTGPAGHPAGHFVGIAGVGPDAPTLPVDHPRAGIFGLERTTRVQDVRDGQANTMMVAGVQDRFDSWAANGASTIRPLSAEPYFAGPDALGTGEQGGMSVLMADGSVRFLSSDTDPRLMRRLAAMADGLPLDAAVPGEPGETIPAPPPVAVVTPVEPAPVEGADSKPIDVEVAPDPVFDIEAALDQPIAAFEQPTPRTVGELLKLIGEMAGVPIDSSQLDTTAALRLEQTMPLSLQDTTVRGLLDASVEKAGLTYSLGNGVVVLLAGSEPAAAE